MNAIALTRCCIIKVCKTSLLSYLAVNPEIYMDICKSLAERLYRKFVLMQKISSHNAEERLKEVIEMMKKEQETKNDIHLKCLLQDNNWLRLRDYVLKPRSEQSKEWSKIRYYILKTAKNCIKQTIFQQIII